jgi:hypothetical protein
VLVEPDGIEPTTSSMPLKLSDVFITFHTVSEHLVNHCLNTHLAIFWTSSHLIESHSLLKTVEPLWNLAGENAQTRWPAERQTNQELAS